ncbi:MAG: CoA-binding protein [Anaerolineae bacterium]|nr:CoA-binding protein [Anaerolineae bacterium]
MPLTSDQDLRILLQNTATIAVVGYSDNPMKASHSVALSLKRAGYDVYFVNPTLESNDQRVVYPSVAAIPVPIDVVDIFRRPENVPPVVEDAIQAGAKAIWMQLGIVNEEAAQRAETANLTVVMNRCLIVEHRRLQPVRTP